jgi:hypothetical protein
MSEIMQNYLETIFNDEEYLNLHFSQDDLDYLSINIEEIG